MTHPNPDTCQCIACCANRGELCPTCLEWVGSVGKDAVVAARYIADARRDALNNYHRQHKEQP